MRHIEEENEYVTKETILLKTKSEHIFFLKAAPFYSHIHLVMPSVHKNYARCPHRMQSGHDSGVFLGANNSDATPMVHHLLMLNEGTSVPYNFVLFAESERLVVCGTFYSDILLFPAHLQYNVLGALDDFHRSGEKNLRGSVRESNADLS